MVPESLSVWFGILEFIYILVAMGFALKRQLLLADDSYQAQRSIG